MPKIRSFYYEKIHQILGDISKRYTEQDALSIYRLKHAAFHLCVLQKKEKLWNLLQNEDYRILQSKQTLDSMHCFDAFRYGIALQIMQHGNLPMDDARLAWLCLRAGSFIKKLRQSTTIAFDWFRTSTNTLDEVLEKLSILDEKRHLTSCLYLIWIECERQQALSTRDRDLHAISRILESIEKKYSTGNTWSYVLSSKFMFHTVETCISVWKSVDLSTLYSMSEDFSLLEIVECFLAKMEQNPQKIHDYTKEILYIFQHIKREKNKLQVWQELIKILLRQKNKTKGLQVVDLLLDQLLENLSLDIKKAYRLYHLINLLETLASHALIDRCFQILKELCLIARKTRERIPEIRIRKDIAHQLQKCIQTIDALIYDSKDNTIWTKFFIHNLTRLIDQTNGVLYIPIITEMIQVVVSREQHQDISNYIHRITDPDLCAQTLFLCGHYDEAMEFASTQPNIDLSKFRRNMIQVMVRNTSLLHQDTYIHFLEDFKDSYFHQRILHHNKQGDVDASIILLSEIESIKYYHLSMEKIVEYLASEGCFDAALQHTSTIKDEPTIDQCKYHIAIEYMKRLHVEEAFQLHQTIIDDRIKNSFVEEAYNIAAHEGIILQVDSEDMMSINRGQLCVSLAQKGMLEEAIQFIEQIRDEHRKSEIMEKVYTILVSQKNITEGLSFAKNIPQKEVKSRVLCDLAHRLFEENRLDELYNFLDDITVNRHVLMDIVHDLEKANHATQASTLYNALLFGMIDKELTSILACRLENGIYDQVFEYLCGEINTDEQEQRDVYISTQLYIFSILGKEEQFNQTLLDTTFFDRHNSLARIALDKFDEGNLEQSLEVANNIEHSQSKKHIIDHIIQLLIYKDRIEDAIDIIQKEQLGFAVFIEILFDLLSKSQIDTIMELVKKHEAFLHSENISQKEEQQKWKLYLLVLQKLFEQNRIEEGLSFVHANKCDGLQKNISEVTSIFLEHHLFDEILSLLSIYPNEVMSAQIVIVKYLLMENRKSEAQNIIERTTDGYGKVMMFLLLLSYSTEEIDATNSIFQQILQILEKEPVLYQNEEVLSELLYMCAKQGWSAYVDTLALKMEDSQTRYLILSKVFSQIDDQAKSLVYLKNALSQIEQEKYDNRLVNFIFAEESASIVWNWERQNLYVALEMCTDKRLQSQVIRHILQKCIDFDHWNTREVRDILEKFALQHQDLEKLASYVIKQNRLLDSFIVIHHMTLDYPITKLLSMIIKHTSSNQVIEVLPKVLECVQRLQDIRYQTRSFLNIVRKVRHLQVQPILHQFLWSSKPSAAFLQNILIEYQRDIRSLQYLRYSLLYIPFDPTISKFGIYNLINEHIKCGNDQHMRDIVRANPILLENISFV